MAKLIWKIVIVGDAAVGKTTIRRKYLGQTTTKEYIYTIGADFATKKIKLSRNLEIQYQIFDLAGQPKFNKVRATFYSGAKAVILVYDITNKKSLTNLPNWIKEARKNSDDSIETFAVVGNKVDLIDQKQTDDDQAMAFTGELSQKMGHGILHIFTSALTGENIDLLFENLTERLLEIAGKDSKVIAELSKELAEDKITSEAEAKISKTKKEKAPPPKAKREFKPREGTLEERVEQLEREIEQYKMEVRELQGELAFTKSILQKYLRGEKKILEELNLMRTRK